MRRGVGRGVCEEGEGGVRVGEEGGGGRICASPKNKFWAGAMPNRVCEAPGFCFIHIYMYEYIM